MHLRTVLIALALLGASGFASAAPKGEELAEIDLTSVHEGKMYYLGCSGETAFTCGIVAVWQEENGKPGLQKRPSSGASTFGKDQKLTL